MGGAQGSERPNARAPQPSCEIEATEYHPVSGPVGVAPGRARRANQESATQTRDGVGPHRAREGFEGIAVDRRGERFSRSARSARIQTPHDQHNSTEIEGREL
jgi:hypothetical protein